MDSLKPVEVSAEIAEALDQLNHKDDWNKQFDLIAHCRGYSSDGKLMRTIYRKDLSILDTIPPLTFAKIIILGYEVKEQ